MPSKKNEKQKAGTAAPARAPEKSKPASAAKVKPAEKEKEKEPVAPEPVRRHGAESFASDDRIFELRKDLLSQRDALLGEAKKEISRIISGENRQLVETALDDGDWSVVDLSEDISFKQLSTHRENLTKIDEALRKLAEGTYGICEDCGEEIDIERLKVMPFAIYCKEDQERREVMEAIERESGI